MCFSPVHHAQKAPSASSSSASRGEFPVLGLLIIAESASLLLERRSSRHPLTATPVPATLVVVGSSHRKPKA